MSNQYSVWMVVTSNAKSKQQIKMLAKVVIASNITEFLANKFIAACADEAYHNGGALKDMVTSICKYNMVGIYDITVTYESEVVPTTPTGE